MASRFVESLLGNYRPAAERSEFAVIAICYLKFPSPGAALVSMGERRHRLAGASRASASGAERFM